MLYRFVHNGIDFVLGDVADFLGAAVQQCFELCNYGGFALGWGNLLWWNGYNADLFVGANRAAEELRISQWTLPVTVITLKFTTIQVIGFHSLWLTYQQRSTKLEDNL